MNLRELAIILIGEPSKLILRFQEGFPEAREWLDDSFLRDDLDRVCKSAREAKKV
jgi:hypothetical protein